MMREENHIFQGMRRDNHPIKQDGKFLWDARNIRITNREDNTLFSITNEKGTSDSLVEFQGYYVGHCVLGKYLVVFTANKDASYCTIYRVEKLEDGTYRTIILFRDSSGQPWESNNSKGWSPNHPIEAIGVYETEFIQKVYWIDGVNQPRVINIAKPELKLPNSIGEGDTMQPLLVDGVNLSGPYYSNDPNIDKYLSYNYPCGFYQKSSFDFVRDLSLGEEINVYRGEGSGLFSPGTIQYAFSYYNKYEQESNIFYTTPINYISPTGRGGSPEERVANFFTIEIYDCDTDFDYIRIYSIHRTSIDAIPTVKIVEDVPINGTENLTFVDDGTKGTTIEPTQLLYVGGKSLIANCIANKDNTLFLGNLELTSKEKDLKDVIMEDWEPDDWELPSASGTESTVSVYYDYTNPLNQGYLAGFQSSETYRCGIQFQTSDGVWSNPIFMDDLVLNTSFTTSGPRESKAFTFLNTENLVRAGIKRMRACIVFPKTYERDVICQGVLCPTVYSVTGRHTDSPYSMSSWFFRPATSIAPTSNNQDVYHGASIQFQHNRPLFTGADRGAELQNMITDSSITDINSITADTYDKFKSYFFVDENIVTFHSPDLEFDTQLQTMDWSGSRLRIVGMAQLDAISGDIDIQTKTPVAHTKGLSSGFIHTPIGYQTRNLKLINGGLVSGLFYQSGQLDEDYNISVGKHFMVYPWHRSGSLNNDTNRSAEDKVRSAVLQKKVISNLKFFPRNVQLDELFNYKISTPVLFSSNEISVEKVTPSYLNKEVPYMGNIDSLLTTTEPYPFYVGTNFHDPNISIISGNSVGGSPLIDSSTEPVRMKYKSSPHLVFSLSGDSANQIKLLPRHASIGGILNGEFTFPSWQNTGSSDGSNDDKGMYDGDFLYIDSKTFSTISNLSTAVGHYAYDRPFGAESGKYSIGLCKANSDGRLVWDYANHTGKVIRIVKDFTLSSREHGNIIPGITADDWGGKYGKSYIGKTKYYRVLSDGVSAIGIPYYKLEEVSESSIDTSIASRKEAPLTFTLQQSQFGAQSDRVSPYLLLAEIIRDVSPDVKFGGRTDEAKRQNLWLPAGRPVRVSGTSPITVPFEYGDTWYSRYDCLKTYPFTQEDENQVVEIGSFMCETRVNIDGRYDRNRGQLSNLNVTPQNFNLLNEIYSQKDNFFNYRILDEGYYKQQIFANQITWSKEKHLGEDVDTWTNITLANTLDLDGTYGKLTTLRTWNEYLLGFQEKSLSQILFNSRVQIPTTDGVPIEISNGYKVDGSRLISSNIGCSNKWATTTTTTGIYFLDSNTDSLYIFNGQLANLSEDRGMNWWVRKNHTDKVWNPIHYRREGPNGVRAFYDNKYGDIYFTPGPIESAYQLDALCYSEQIGQFTSLMSYGGTQAMFNYANGFYSLRETDGNVKLYQNNVGSYNNFYGEYFPFSISFIANDNPAYTKIFDTVELRADSYANDILTRKQPFSSIQAENEYQESGTSRFEDNPRSIRKKFRVWRINIPRSSKVASREIAGFDISRGKLGRARIRNPWTMITLTNDEGDSNKVVLHDLTVKYTI